MNRRIDGNDAVAIGHLAVDKCIEQDYIYYCFEYILKVIVILIHHRNNYGDSLRLKLTSNASIECFFNQILLLSMRSAISMNSHEVSPLAYPYSDAAVEAKRGKLADLPIIRTVGVENDGSPTRVRGLHGFSAFHLHLIRSGLLLPSTSILVDPMERHQGYYYLLYSFAEEHF